MEEVLRGDKYAPSGVCPHQCWSETMLIQPVIEGMLGIIPDATRNEIMISPALPTEWDSINVSNIRIGQLNMDFSMLRQKNIIRYTFSYDGPDSIKIIFCPQFEDGSSVQKVWVNGKEAPEKSYRKDGHIAEIVLYLTGHCVIEISLSGGIGLLTPANRPLPNEASSNLRIIDTQFENRNYIITLEGAPGMKYELQLLNRLGAPQKVTGATYITREDILQLAVMFPAMEQAYQRRRIEIQF